MRSFGWDRDVLGMCGGGARDKSGSGGVGVSGRMAIQTVVFEAGCSCLGAFLRKWEWGGKA